MKNILFIILILCACNKPAKICPDCLETNCIYQSINDRVKGETDIDIYNAVIDEVKERGITDSLTVDNILANYYL